MRPTYPAVATPFAHALTTWMWHAHRVPMTTPELARLIGVTRQTVNNWLSKRALPDLDRQLAIFEQLGIAPAALLRAYRDLGEEPPTTLLRLCTSDAAVPEALDDAPAHDDLDVADQPTLPLLRQGEEPTPFQMREIMLRHAEASLRMAGYTDEAIRHAMNYLRRTPTHGASQGAHGASGQQTQVALGA